MSEQHTEVMPAIARFAAEFCRLWNRWAADRMLEGAARYRAESNDAGVRRMEMKARWYLQGEV